MSEIKALEKLREYAANNCRAKGWQGNLRMIADEIEAEVAARFMLLPLDADGVPIHAGDELFDYKTVRSVVAVSPVFVVMGGYEDGDSVRLSYARNHRHVRPRALEDVLRDFAYKWCSLAPEDFDGGYPSRVVADCAAEIRELMGGSE